MFSLDCSTVNRGAPWLVTSAPRCTQCSLQRSQTYHNHSHGTPEPVIRDLSNFEGRPQYPPSVWYTPKIDASKFILHIFSDTSGGSQRLKYILLIYLLTYSTWRLSLNFIPMYYLLVLYGSQQGYFSFVVWSCTFIHQFYIIDKPITLYTWLSLVPLLKQVVNLAESKTIL
jgi:hypothetical protein